MNSSTVPPEYWALVVIFLGVGFLLGWLITAMPNRRKLAQAQAGAKGIDAKLQQANSDLSASQQREQALLDQLEAAKAEVAASHQRDQDLQDKAAAQEAELEEIRLRYAALQTAAKQTYSEANSHVEGLHDQVNSLTEENKALKANLEGISADMAKARADLETANQALANKDTALTEAYGRAVRLERETTDEQSRLLSLQAEVAALKREKATLLATNQEVQERLENARGEVANELAVLTSTMLRVKDEQLAQAQATIAALQAQLAQPPAVSSSTR